MLVLLEAQRRTAHAVTLEPTHGTVTETTHAVTLEPTDGTVTETSELQLPGMRFHQGGCRCSFVPSHAVDCDSTVYRQALF